MRISDWSSDVCSSDLCEARVWQSRQRPEKRRLADRRSAICYIPNLRDRSARAFRFIDQHLDHRRNRERGGHGLFLDKLQSRLRVKRGQDDMRSAEHGHAEYAARISEVKHRPHVEGGEDRKSGGEGKSVEG